MTQENLTTWDEVDGASEITVTADSIAVASANDTDHWVSKDGGAAHWADFSWDFWADCVESLGTERMGIIAVTNVLQDIIYWREQDSEAYGVYFQGSTGSDVYTTIYNYETNGYDRYTVQEPGEWWFTLARSGTTGTCAVYIDADRTMIDDTLAEVFPDGRTYRYAAIGTTGLTSNVCTWDVGYVDLGEVPASGNRRRRVLICGRTA